jgi:hypothetical protein
MADAELKKELQELLGLMQDVLEDHSVPRNIRTIIEEAMQKVSGKKAKIEDFSTAVYMMDDISKDLNIPSHTRTDIWEMISRMEAIKEKLKE